MKGVLVLVVVAVRRITAIVLVRIDQRLCPKFEIHLPREFVKGTVLVIYVCELYISVCMHVMC